MNHSMPGSFPGSYGSTSYQPRQLQKATTNERLASQLTQSTEMTRFFNTTYINTKTKAQHHLIGQLGLIVYVLAFYQYVKYCHSAALIPLLFHCIYQVVLSIEILTNANLQVIRHLLSDTTEPEEQQFVLNNRMRFVCRMLYTKCLFVLLYHILFVCSWMVSIVNRGQLQELTYGTWWVVSFIGEEVPDISPEVPYHEKLLKLGLIQLLFIDLIVLFLELVMFQCIYKQSPILKIERRLNEQEIYCVRQSTSPNISVNEEDVSQEDVPTVLKVKLYQCFKREGYLDVIGQ
ncbi:uncharacterized protein SPAPADRAFT_57764 [Spathaspora passalidarum NRRL Y-27907]|uniref:Uncharacterized protein n=1 Tax=Spathaspora passalidarum (strain NRRL Y-27907 / 11-Y1) TaxID=619300 RepID=G3ADX6_SPAPN|nr:uncharacterized protein SPAPADRAFT_57764 [Spathaspora passalidarum NRRL Y-27907]EGW34700.1 hypothetical protein SPAPADRAFT_57764 [Spathaspora passalidarum NRRL Y-27907]